MEKPKSANSISLSGFVTKSALFVDFLVFWLFFLERPRRFFFLEAAVLKKNAAAFFSIFRRSCYCMAVKAIRCSPEWAKLSTAAGRQLQGISIDTLQIGSTISPIKGSTISPIENPQLIGFKEHQRIYHFTQDNLAFAPAYPHQKSRVAQATRLF